MVYNVSNLVGNIAGCFKRSSRMFGRGLKLGHSRNAFKNIGRFLDEVLILFHTRNSTMLPFENLVQKQSGDYFWTRFGNQTSSKKTPYYLDEV